MPDARAEALARVAPMWYELCCPEVLSAKVSGCSPPLLGPVGSTHATLQLREWEAGSDLISAYDLIRDLLANCGQQGAETVATVAARVCVIGC